MAKRTASKHGKRTRNEAVAQLMAALGDSYSYRKLAKEIGLPDTSFSLLHKIVDGSIRKLQPELALQLMAFTGADSKSLEEGKRALDLGGRPYTRQSFDSWRSAQPADDVVEATADRAAELVRAIVLGAYGAGSAHRFNMIALLLSRALEGLVGRFKLVGHVNAALKDRARMGPWQETTLGRLKAALGIEHAGEPIWDEKTARSHSDETKVEARAGYRALWSPLAGRGRTTAGEGFFAHLVALNEEVVEVRFPWAPKTPATFEGTRLITAGTADMGSALFAKPRPVQTPKRKRSAPRQARRSTTKKKARK
jgi:hypothetical protein